MRHDSHRAPTTVHAAVVRALASLTAPAGPELAALEREMRGHAEALLPAAEAAVDALPHTSPAWWEHRTRLDVIRRQLQQSPPEGPLPANVRVQLLARDCTWLLTHQEGTP